MWAECVGTSTYNNRGERCTTAVAGCTSFAVGVERPRKISGFSCSIDVETIKRCAAHSESFPHNALCLGKDTRELRIGQSGGKTSAMDLCCPQCFICVDIANAGNNFLVQ